MAKCDAAAEKNKLSDTMYNGFGDGMFEECSNVGSDLIQLKDQVRDFSEGLAAARIDGGGDWGYIGKTGAAVIPGTAAEASSTSTGRARS